ncbi:Mitochondrial pyruvate carrier 2 [Perkinsus chesapeaki]|uniref:Mitochondrial pyruvate carrier n=1 Tax=Perkinsus chesapeaki TaxID=330153 RepID=A0A7J6M226_PERCH|nr:Mitochondrial pyruvate carrier 2 [Perkinsus chesapeaki]
MKYDRQLQQQQQQEEQGRLKDNMGLTVNDDGALLQTSAKRAMMCAAVATGFGIVPRLQKKVCALPMPSKVRLFLQHPAGPFTIFFWAPTCKWGLSAANLMDYKRPVHAVSVPQQLALFATGAIWARWSFVITPVNINLALVNIALASSALYMLVRKYIHDPFPSTNVNKKNEGDEDNREI